MVQLMKSGDLLSEQDTAACTDKPPVKLEIEDSLEDEDAPLSKRTKPSSAFQEVFFFFFFFLDFILFGCRENKVGKGKYDREY